MAAGIFLWLLCFAHFFNLPFWYIWQSLDIMGNLYKAFRSNTYISRDMRVKKVVNMAKFMQSLDDEIYNKLQEIANSRGITIQELIRAVIIPEWLNKRT